MSSPIYKKLGASGLSISPIIVGCMSFDEEKIFKILKKCYDNGMRTFDTADVYSNGYSDVLLGKFLKKYNIPRDKVVIMTKFFSTVDTNVPEFDAMREAAEKHVFYAVQGSVERLGTYIDVLQIHRLDSTTPKAEIMKALNDVFLAGHARYLGASSMKAVEFAELQYIADKNGWFKFISMQNYYNLLYREEERVGIIPWSPIARGILARPVGAKSTNNRSAATDVYQTYFDLGNNSKADDKIINRVEELAKKHNVSMASIASTWVLSKGAIPILGLNSEARVDDALMALTVKLTKEEISYLEEPYEPKRVFGHEQGTLSRDAVETKNALEGYSEHLTLGASGLSDSPIIVGCMTYGKKSWREWVMDDEDKIFKILKKCYDNGIRTFDTADAYSNGHSEVILGKFLKAYDIPREKVVILTKLFATIDTRITNFNIKTESQYPEFEFANNKGLSRKHIFDAIQGSVERLGTYVDVVQIHRLDETTPKRNHESFK
ncbi:NADP-dependent oxidoreductase domain-containing protein [Scheffersomyces xylosifermentans]|uniref:NADP-dependent oxidoreductase domain-containing protein n=1 Tax=Scheffersomyces xylosifermentans TaxID=1304137 RepID=UPI00315DB559